MAKRIPITVSDDLFAAAEILRKQRGYRSKSEYIAGLIRYDAQTQKPHHLTADWAALTGYERDRLDAGLLRDVKNGKGIKGSWLEARIAEIVKTHVGEGKPPEVKDVARELAQNIIERAD